MTLPLAITAGDPGHIGDHEELHDLVDHIASPFIAGAIATDTYANRPAAGTAGRWYVATDTGEVFVDTGSAWITIVPPAPAQDLNAGLQSTSSTSFTDLGTVGPDVTVVVGDSGKLLVGISAVMAASTISGTNAQPQMSYELSGANTVSADGDHSIRDAVQETVQQGAQGVVILHTGLNRGSTTITAKYRCGDGSDTVTFQDRRLWAQPLAN